MTFWTIYLRNPQSLRVRKKLFQIHMWVGIGIGLYLLDDERFRQHSCFS